MRVLAHVRDAGSLIMDVDYHELFDDSPFPQRVRCTPSGPAVEECPAWSGWKLHGALVLTVPLDMSVQQPLDRRMQRTKRKQ